MEAVTTSINRFSCAAIFAAALWMVVPFVGADTFLWNGNGVSGGETNDLLDNPSAQNTWTLSGVAQSINPGATDTASLTLTSGASLGQTSGSVLDIGTLQFTATAQSTLAFNGTNTIAVFSSEGLTTVRVLSGVTTITDNGTIGENSHLLIDGTGGVLYVGDAAGEGLTIALGASMNYGASGGTFIGLVTNFGLFANVVSSSNNATLSGALVIEATGSANFEQNSTSVQDRTFTVDGALTNSGKVFVRSFRPSGSGNGMTLTVTGNFFNLAGSNLSITAQTANLAGNSRMRAGVNVLGDMQNGGTIRFQLVSRGNNKPADASLHVTGNFTNEGRLIVNPSLDLVSGDAISNSVAITVGGFFLNTADGHVVLVAGGQSTPADTVMTVGSSLTNEGTLSLRAFRGGGSGAGMTLTVNGDFINSAGSNLSITAESANVSGASFMRTGLNVLGDIQNSGTIRFQIVSRGNNKPADTALSVTGNFTNAGSLIVNPNIDLFSVDSNSNSTAIIVDGFFFNTSDGNVLLQAGGVGTPADTRLTVSGVLTNAGGLAIKPGGAGTAPTTLTAERFVMESTGSLSVVGSFSAVVITGGDAGTNAGEFAFDVSGLAPAAFDQFNFDSDATLLFKPSSAVTQSLVVTGTASGAANAENFLISNVNVGNLSFVKLTSNANLGSDPAKLWVGNLLLTNGSSFDANGIPVGISNSLALSSATLEAIGAGNELEVHFTAGATLTATDSYLRAGVNGANQFLNLVADDPVFSLNSGTLLITNGSSVSLLAGLGATFTLGGGALVVDSMSLTLTNFDFDFTGAIIAANNAFIGMDPGQTFTLNTGATLIFQNSSSMSVFLGLGGPTLTMNGGNIVADATSITIFNISPAPVGQFIEINGGTINFNTPLSTITISVPTTHTTSVTTYEDVFTDIITGGHLTADGIGLSISNIGSINTGATLSSIGGSIHVGGISTNDGILEAGGGGFLRVDGLVVNDGGLQILGSSISIPDTVQNANMIFSDSGTIIATSLTTNIGLIQLTANGISATLDSASSGMTSGGSIINNVNSLLTFEHLVTNTSGGLIQVGQGGASLAFLEGLVIDSGASVNFTEINTNGNKGGTIIGNVTNFGFINNNVASGASPVIDGVLVNEVGGTFNVVAQIVSSPGHQRTFTITSGLTNAGDFLVQKNNTANGGSVIRGVTLTVASGGVTNLAGATLTIQANVTLTSSSQTTYAAMNIAGGGDLVNEGVLYLNASGIGSRNPRADLNVDGAITNTGQIAVQTRDSSANNSSTIRVGTSFDNSSTFSVAHLTGSGTGNVTLTGVGGGTPTFVNRAGAVVEVSGNTALDVTGATFSNEGTTTISSGGRLAVKDISQTGNIVLDTGGILSGTQNWTNNGNLIITDGQTQMNSALVNEGEILKSTAGVGAISGGEGLNANSGLIRVTGGTLLVNSVNTGLISLWHFDGDFTDSAGSNHGTPVNGTTATMIYTGDPKLGSGAGSFNGSTQYINTGNDSSVQLTAGTVFGWVKTTDTDGNFNGIIAKQNAFAIFDKNGNLTTYSWASPTGEKNSGASGFIADGSWHQVAMTFQSGVTNGTVLYVDGAAVLTTTMAVSNQNVSLYLGYANASQQYLRGNLDEAALFDRVLSPSEIAAFYNSGAGVELSSSFIKSLLPSASFTNQAGASISVEGGVMDISDAPFTNVGTVAVFSGGMIVMGTVTSQTGTITATDSIIAVQQNWTNDGYIAIAHSEIRTGDVAGAGLFTNAMYLSTGSSINSNFNNTGTFTLTDNTSITGNFTNAGWTNPAGFNLTLLGSLNANTGNGLTNAIFVSTGTLTLSPTDGEATFTNDITSTATTGGNYDIRDLTFNMESGTINFEVTSTDMGSGAFSQLANGYAMGTLTLPNTLTFLRLLDDTINQGGGTQEAIYVENLHLGTALTASNFDFGSNLKIYYNHIVGDGGGDFVGTLDGAERVVYFSNIIPMNAPAPPSGVVPEPSTLVLLFLGLPLIWFLQRRGKVRTDGRVS